MEMFLFFRLNPQLLTTACPRGMEWKGIVSTGYHVFYTVTYQNAIVIFYCPRVSSEAAGCTHLLLYLLCKLLFHIEQPEANMELSDAEL